MPLSGYLVTSDYDGRYYKLDWVAEPDIPANKSKIIWTLQALGGNAESYPERTLKVKVAGVEDYSKTTKVDRSVGVIASDSVTVRHNDDGSKSFTASVQVAVNGSTVNCTGSQRFTLTNIKQLSTLSVEDGTLGQPQTMTVTKYLGEATSESGHNSTHTVTATCGSKSITILENSPETMKSFTLPRAWASENTTGSYVSVLFEITTYNGETVLGTLKYTRNYKISNALPSVTINVEDLVSNPEVYGGYVQGVSSLNVTIDASGAYGATIESYATEVDGKTYTEQIFETPVLSQAGELAIDTTVRDSRSSYLATSKTITVHPYELPKISALSVRRCKQDGTIDSRGTWLEVVFTATVSPVNNKNTAKYVINYKKTGDSSYASKEATSYANQYSVTNGVYRFEASESSYEITFEVKDAFNTSPRDISVSSSSKLFSVYGKGLGFALGKLAELKGYFEVGFKSLFHDDVHVKGALTYDIPVYSTDYDCDTMLTSGKFYLGTGALHRPVETDGWLEVESHDNGKYCHQNYLTNTGVLYQRFRMESTWGDWAINTGSSGGGDSGVTLEQLGVTATATELNYVDGVTSNIQTQLNKKANDYSLELYNGTGGNPKPVKFMTINYSTCGSENGVAIKVGMVSGHGNGSSYAFLEDAIFRVTYLGGVEVDNFKYYGADTGTYDGASRQYGDIFWVIDTTNKIVDFYCLMGQYARLQMTPHKRVTYSTGGTITQYTSCTVYSSGTKVWANNSEIATLGDITDTTYTAGTGISINGTTINNIGVTDVSTGTVNGSVSVTVNGQKKNAFFGGIGSCAYASTSDFDPAGSANGALTNAKSYTDTAIANLINGAPTTLDTLGEIATAMANNSTVVQALNDAIGTKANASDLTSHTGNKSNPHSVTCSQIGALPIGGGNMTGALSVNSLASVDTNGYVTGTWLRTTDTTNASAKSNQIVVLNNGWLYYRTPEQILSDIGACPDNHTHNTASSTSQGMMSASDKVKLDGMDTRVSELDYMVRNMTAYQFRGYIKLLKLDTTSYDGSYNTFLPIHGSIDSNIQSANVPLTYKTYTLTVGDRTNTTVHGVLIGTNVTRIRVSANVRYKNNDSSNTQLHTYLNYYNIQDGQAQVIKKGGASSIIDGSSYLTHSIDTIIDVQKDDFVFLQSYKGTAGRDIDVLSDYNATYLCVEAIG